MRQLCAAVVLITLFTLIINGCAGNGHINDSGTDMPYAFEIPVPTAPGINEETNETAIIDFSNKQDGYIIVKYIGNTDKSLRVLVTAPHDAQYVYMLNNEGVVDVIPLTEGDGEYTIGVYENVEADDYSQLLSLTINVALNNEFTPFIRPNQFVNYTKDSDLVGLATELTKDVENVKDKIIAIYDYVIDNFTYDYDLAANVKSGYLPNLDEVLRRKEGICFDYSALVTAMLRSQGIPARLEIGYHGEQYHAWISLFCEDNGWIEKRYHYDYAEEEWTAMDPTLESDVRHAHKSRQQARDDEEYRLMYNY